MLGVDKLERGEAMTYAEAVDRVEIRKVSDFVWTSSDDDALAVLRRAERVMGAVEGGK